MVVSRTVDILIEGQKVEQVKKFKYLGTDISEDGRCIDDVKQRCSHEQGKHSRKRVTDSGGMNREVKEKDW